MEKLDAPRLGRDHIYRMSARSRCRRFTTIDFQSAKNYARDEVERVYWKKRVGAHFGGL